MTNSTPYSFPQTLIFNYKTGLLLGGTLGLFSGGPFGLFFGAAIGLMIQRFIKRSKSAARQNIFFRAAFSVMGKIAKADGRVSESEIDFARHVMQQMRLSDPAKQRAIQYFNEGKQPDFEIQTILKPFSVLFQKQTSMKMMFLELQLQIAMADGEFSSAELRVIEEVCSQLQFSPAELQAILKRIQAAQSFQGQYSWQFSPEQNQASKIAEAYSLLGITEKATNDDIKRAWRKLMSQHHPDKLVANGLPESMQAMAKEKTQEIQSAYNLLREVRGMR